MKSTNDYKDIEYLSIYYLQSNRIGAFNLFDFVRSYAHTIQIFRIYAQIELITNTYARKSKILFRDFMPLEIGKTTNVRSTTQITKVY